MGESGHDGSGRSANTLHSFTPLGKPVGWKTRHQDEGDGQNGKKSLQKRCSQSNKRHQMWQRDLLPLLSKHTQSWICARQLGRQDIANSSLKPREFRPCFWQADAAFAAGRQQTHPLPSCRSSFPRFFKAKCSHYSNNY